MTTEYLPDKPLPPEEYQSAPQQVAAYPQQQVSLVVIPVKGGGFQAVPMVNNNITNKSNVVIFAPPENNSYEYSAAGGGHRIFADTSKRQVFVRKVYGIVSAQLLTVTGFMSVFLFHPTLWTDVKDDVSLLFEVVIYTFPLIIIVGCCACYCSMPKRSPGNIICLVLHTMALAFFFAIISAAVNDKTIWLAVLITAIVCVILTIFATNFATCGGILLAVAMILVAFSILMLSLRTVFPIPGLVCACVGALIFSTFLVYDTQLMVAGKHRQSSDISCEDYIFAVHTFHMDLMVVWFCRCPRKCC